MRDRQAPVSGEAGEGDGTGSRPSQAGRDPLGRYGHDQHVRALPGADDRRFVQSNPTWSPDGKQIVFARSKAHRLEGVHSDAKVLLNEAECREFLEEGRTFLFDLYRIPFNDGRGGKPEPLEGASPSPDSALQSVKVPPATWNR